jgi:hypothetical protein
MDLILILLLGTVDPDDDGGGVIQGTGTGG